jgi:hypothetical protein
MELDAYKNYWNRDDDRHNGTRAPNSYFAHLMTRDCLSKQNNDDSGHLRLSVD